MKYLSTTSHTARRVIAVIAAASAGLIVTAAALAAGSPGGASGTALASDTTAVSPTSVPACQASQLGVWMALAQSNGAAGTIYYPLNFTNVSTHACYLHGFPGVSAIARNGHQLGSPAGWATRVAARTVVLAPGATGHTILRYGDAEVSAPGCDPVNTAVVLRVYPPNRYNATIAAFDLEACSHAGPVYMSVEPILPGVGTING
ncbi:MAG: DUF4232 domain-containing protein [Streptosporangiaceae bacterium]|jgi:hypothetical protein